MFKVGFVGFEVSIYSFGIGVYIFYGQVSTPENEIQGLQEQQGDQREGEAQVDLQEGRVIVEWQLRFDWPEKEENLHQLSMFYVTFHHLNIEEIKTMMTINTPTRAELRHNGIIKQNEPRKQRTAREVKSFFSN